MIQNYFKIAWRQIIRHKGFSIINIIGLSISLAVGLVIIMMVTDQLLYDTYNRNKERVYRINTEVLRKNEVSSLNKYATTSLPVGHQLAENYTGIVKSARLLRGFGNGWVEFDPDNDLNIPLGGFFADPEIIEILDLEFEFGNPVTALVNPYSVVITRQAANKLFKEKNPVGELIKVGELGEYKVTGVLKNTQSKSHVIFEALASISTTPTLIAEEKLRPDRDSWKNCTAGWVYVLLTENKNPQEVDVYLREISQKFGSENDDRNFRYYLQSITEINPGPFLANQIGPGMPMIMVYFLGGLALIVILTACFNYTNLSIARALNRAKEVGIRKVSGAKRRQIIWQFLGESILISLFALSLSFILLIFIQPAFRNLSFSRILQWDLTINLPAIFASVIVAITVGILAGILPAMLLSSFQPIKALKNLSGMKLLSRVGLRKGLLAVQFGLSIIFIISVHLIYNQMNYMMNADYGFNYENNVRLALGESSWRNMKSELLSYSDIENVSVVSHIPAAGTTYGDTFFKELNDPRSMDYFSVDQDFIENLELQLLAGRNFPEQLSEGETMIIINEKAVDEFGYSSPLDAIGQTLYNADTVAVQIIGVVKNFHHALMMQQIEPMALRYRPQQFKIIQVKMANPEAIASVVAAWEKVNPGKLINYKLMGDEIKELYQLVFGGLAKIISFISFLAIVISCLGLLGMATYTIETRLKEISIRKVLGSSDWASIYLLSKGFIALLGITIVFAVPLAILINNLWLQLIAFRVGIGASVVVTSILIIMILGLFTIGSQTLRALKVNPAEILRNE
jgi:putative ABC transport system permease protein